MDKNFYIVFDTTGLVMPVRAAHHIVEAPNAAWSTSEILDAPDNPHMAVIPLLEMLTEGPDEDAPDFDTVEAAGLDGTLRSVPSGTITWKDVALALLERKPTLVMTRELLELFEERRDEVEDGDNSLERAEFVIDGVRVVID